MPLFGNLREINLSRLLTLLADGRKSGVLTIRTKGNSAEAVIHCGRLLSARLAEGKGAVETAVAGKAPPADHEAVNGLAGNDEAAAALFAEFFGLSTRSESLARMREAALAALRAARDWPEAEFHFGAWSRLPAATVSVGLPLKSVAERLGAAG